MRYVGSGAFRCTCGETFRATDAELIAIDLHLCPKTLDAPEFLPDLIGLCMDISQHVDPIRFDHDHVADESDLTFLVDLNIVRSHRHILSWHTWREELAEAADDLGADILEVAA
jgi:hypothetical protein